MAYIKLRSPAYRKLRKLAGVATDTALAELLEVDRITLHRTIAGKTGPSSQFIAGVVNAFGVEWFGQIFEVFPGKAK